MKNLKMLGILASLGYEKFIPTNNYLISDLHYTSVSLRNRETDPLIFELGSENGDSMKIWKHVFNKVVKRHSWDIESVIFNDNLYINADGFVICCEETDIASIVQFSANNVFDRPSINGVDDRVDLGDLIFILSDIGILYSAYEYPMHKVVDNNNQKVTIFSTVNDLALNTEVKYLISDKAIGAYGDPFVIKTVHVLPNDFNAKS